MYKEDRKLLKRLKKAHYVRCTKCTKCGRKSHWSNPYDITPKNKCWGCGKKTRHVEITDDEFWSWDKNARKKIKGDSK